jgi:hypothetical protein
MQMIEIWLKITFIFINGQSGIKSVCDECKNNVYFFFTSENRNLFLSLMFILFEYDRIKFLCMKKLKKNWFLGHNNIYTSLGKREFTSLVTV